MLCSRCRVLSTFSCLLSFYFSPLYRLSCNLQLLIGIFKLFFATTWAKNFWNKTIKIEKKNNITAFKCKNSNYVAFKYFGLRVPDEGYSRNASCAPRMISALLLRSKTIFFCYLDESNLSFNNKFFLNLIQCITVNYGTAMFLYIKFVSKCTVGWSAVFIYIHVIPTNRKNMSNKHYVRCGNVPLTFN